MREREESPVVPTDVLYVDSDDDFAVLVQRTLTSLDPTVSVDHVPSASAAMERIDEGYDCVVSSYSLNDTDAISFLEEFRRTYPDRPFVLFTGGGSEEVAGEAIAAGVSAYVPVRTGENNFELLAQRIWTVTRAYRTRKRAEAAEDELREAYQRTSDGVVAVDPEWRIIFANDRLADRRGLDADAIEGEVLWQAVPEFAGTRIESVCRRVTDDRETASVEVVLGDDDRLSIRAHPDREGGVIIYAQDVTARWLAERRTECLSGAVDCLNTPAVVVDPALSVEYRNEAAGDRLGIAAPSSPGAASLDDLASTPDADAVAGAVQEVMARALNDGGVPPATTVADDAGSHGDTADGNHHGDAPTADAPASRATPPDGDASATLAGVQFETPDGLVSATLRVDPFAVDGDPFALVVADEVRRREK